jgi:hypothetical protein
LKKLLLLAAAATLMAACAESSTAPTSSTRKAARTGASADLICESGYLVAYDEMGEPYCAPAGRTASQPMISPTIKP